MILGKIICAWLRKHGGLHIYRNGSPHCFFCGHTMRTVKPKNTAQLPLIPNDQA